LLFFRAIDQDPISSNENAGSSQQPTQDRQPEPGENDGCKLAARKRSILPKATDFINR
jgi:hypothetical protein